MAVNRATIHHQGAGAPNDNYGGFSEGGYSYGIGKTGWSRFRSPYDSWATLNYNHVSLDVCLSGNRMDYVVTDQDIRWLHEIFMDCYHRNEVVATPEVIPHRNSPGSATVCPGDHTMARWNDVVNQFHLTPGPTPPSPTPSPTVPPWPGTYLRDYTNNHGTLQWQQQMAHRGWTITCDDKYGPQSAQVCLAFQREKGLQVDGIVGPQTWNATWTAPIT